MTNETIILLAQYRGLEAAGILLLILIAVGIVVYAADRLKPNKGNSESSGQEPQQPSSQQGECSLDCCSTHNVCPSQELLAAQQKPIVYYDDQELDDFKGRQASDYTPDEIDRFRDVLYTLLPADLMGWQQSLKRRGIAMPEPIASEFVMLYNESHTGQAQ